MQKKIAFMGFFFFKQKTAYEMSVSDWSLDVCSSDLARAAVAPARLRHVVPPGHVEQADLDRGRVAARRDPALHQRLRAERSPADEVDLPGGDAGGLRVLDEGLRIEEAEVAREVEVARQHLREACAELAARVTAQVLERHD